jgi:hypothetical protein
MTDEELREALKELDTAPDVDVDSWEAEFIEHVVYKYKGPLSEPQRKKAEEIIEKYMA